MADSRWQIAYSLWRMEEKSAWIMENDWQMAFGKRKKIVPGAVAPSLGWPFFASSALALRPLRYYKYLFEGNLMMMQPSRPYAICHKL